jgi:hypothetical protein
MARDLTGQAFGKWTVQGESITTEKGERKWLCRCSCGTERYVLERSLLSGESLSCGCLRRENAAKAVSPDLTDQVFGELTALHRIPPKQGDKRTWWLCKCSCGQECEIAGTLLVTGKRRNCGDTRYHPKSYAFKDITGRRFHLLVALYPLKERSKKGSVQWHCRCDCGNELDVAYNDLTQTKMKSCGCIRRQHEKNLKNYLTHVDSTSLDMIKSKKIPIDNTTGVKGVYHIRGKYIAKIVFQKKAYYLGTYDNIEKAKRARHDAEVLLFNGTIEFYRKWEQRASSDQDWAAKHPIQIHVEKDHDKGLQVRYLPEL